MIVLWIFLFLLCLAGTYFVYRAFTEATPTLENTQKTINKTWYEEQLRNLESLYIEKSLTEAQFQEEKIQLQKDFLTTIEVTEKPRQSRPHPIFAIIVCIFLISGSLMTYAKLGASNELAKLYAIQAAQAKSDAEIKAMGGEAGVVHQLQEKLKIKPDAEGFYLLGRIYFNQEHYHEAYLTFQKASRLAPERADIATELAEASYFSSNPADRLHYPALLKKALALDPQNPAALNLSALFLYHQKKYAEAIDIWQKLLAQSPENSDTAQALAAAIQDAQKKLGGGGASGSAQASLAITVNLDPSLRAQLKPTDILFVYAKAVGGSPMPLAIARVPVKDFPVQIILDDSMTMSPTVHLHDAKTVIVEARISHSGQAMPQTGDLTGQSGIINMKAAPKNISVQIQKQVI